MRATEDSALSPDVEKNHDAPESAKTCGAIRNYPASVWFILITELCERFSYYGMRAILVLFLNEFIHLGWLSDTYLGRFRTILVLSLVYIAGGVILTVGGFPGIYPSDDNRNPAAAYIGMTLIAIGTGGIKPCVSAFGGDQLSNAAQLTTFFTIFYICINTGSLASTIITPQLKASLSDNIKFVVAFGLPAGLLAVATIVFFLGRNKYKHIPPNGSVLSRVGRIIFSALRARCTPTCLAPCGGTSRHWLDRASSEFSPAEIADVKVLLRVCKVFLPLPVFWALFDQQGSRWTLQARDMNRYLGEWQVPEATVQAVNPMLIIALAPLFERLLYPLVNRCIRVTPLRRIAVGMFLGAVSFVICAFVQLWMDGLPLETVHVAWQLPQYVVLTMAEVLCSITGLEFAYAEAPISMKSVVMAFFLITVAIGNLLVSVSSEVDICGPACNYFFFAALMVVAMAWFAYAAWRYAKDKEEAGAAETPVDYDTKPLVEDSAAASEVDPQQA